MSDFSPAKARLLLEHPFFGTIASAMEMRPNDDIESFRFRNGAIEYRKGYAGELSENQKMFLLCNGALHEALSHTLRRGNRSPWLWEMACDYAINALLVDNGFEPPQKILHDERFGDLSTEEIYEQLSGEFSDQERNDRDMDEGRDPQNADERLSRAQREKRLQEAQAKGDPLDEALERLLGRPQRSAVDWRSILRDTIGGYYISDYTLIPPSKKLLYEGIYLPGVHSRHLDLVIAIDTSGSVDEVLLGAFIAEIETITELFGSYTIDLLTCDDRIRSHRRFDTGEAIEYTLSGGGGTDFSPVFEAIGAAHAVPKLLLYFTDLEGIFPPVEPPYETLWIAPKGMEVPFGKVITIGDGDA